MFKGFTSLPDGNKVTFQDVPPVDLQPLLLNAPPGDHPTFSGSHAPPLKLSNSPIDLIYRLLVYPPEERLSAVDARQHPWFSSTPLALPDGYPHDGNIVLARQDEGQSLSNMLASFTHHATFGRGIA